MIRVTIPASKMRVFKCINPDCTHTKGDHWVTDTGRAALATDTWVDALALALSLARQDSRRRGGLEPTC